jgi:hypothetical protein
VGESVNILETTNDCRSADLAVTKESGSWASHWLLNSEF